MKGYNLIRHEIVNAIKFPEMVAFPTHKAKSFIFF